MVKSLSSSLQNKAILTKLNILKMVQMHVNHGFEHDRQNEKMLLQTHICKGHEM